MALASLDLELKPIEEDEHAMLAVLVGSVDGNSVSKLERAFEDLLGRGVLRLILDLHGLRYMNSTGLGFMVKFADAFKSAGGGIALIRVPSKIQIIIDMSGLTALLDIHHDLATAVSALRSGGSRGHTAPDASPVEDGVRSTQKSTVARVAAGSTVLTSAIPRPWTWQA
jgi:anti-sigma B factor antagonist